ncbi:MAG: CarD family transcriptional regulator [Methylovirgula sp.]
MTAPRSPATRNETQKVLSERRAHAEAVLALRANNRKLAPKNREPAPAGEKAPKKVAGPTPQPTRAGAAATGVMPPRPFGARPGDIRLPERPGFRPAPKPPGAVKLGFKPAEYIVYPAHGVGQILAIEEQEVAGFKLELFVISFSKDKMILKVPTPKTVSVGMRKLASSDVVKQALTTLTGRARVKRTMWSRRAQEYEAKINSGDLVAIAEVIRDLYRSEAQPEQSYSERQLYEAALDRVAREISVVQKLTETESLKLIESQLQKGPRRGKAEEGEADAAADSEEGVEEAA